MAGDRIVCDFFSDVALLDGATHYRSQERGKDMPGQVSKIVRREQCPLCGRTILISTDTGINATFSTRHIDCTKRLLAAKGIEV